MLFSLTFLEFYPLAVAHCHGKICRPEVTKGQMMKLAQVTYSIFSRNLIKLITRRVSVVIRSSKAPIKVSGSTKKKIKLMTNLK